MQQIADWLKQLGMRAYIQRFAENDIDFAILSDLTDQDLEKIGVTSLGHRRKLLRAIADLKGVGRSSPDAVAAAPPATPRVADAAERRQVTRTWLVRPHSRPAAGLCGRHGGGDCTGPAADANACHHVRVRRPSCLLV